MLSSVLLLTKTQLFVSLTSNLMKKIFFQTRIYKSITLLGSGPKWSKDKALQLKMISYLRKSKLKSKIQKISVSENKNNPIYPLVSTFISHLDSYSTSWKKIQVTIAAFKNEIILQKYFLTAVPYGTPILINEKQRKK